MATRANWTRKDVARVYGVAVSWVRDNEQVIGLKRIMRVNRCVFYDPEQVKLAMSRFRCGAAPKSN